MGVLPGKPVLPSDIVLTKDTEVKWSDPSSGLTTSITVPAGSTEAAVSALKEFYTTVDQSLVPPSSVALGQLQISPLTLLSMNSSEVIKKATNLAYYGLDPRVVLDPLQQHIDATVKTYPTLISDMPGWAREAAKIIPIVSAVGMTIVTAGALSEITGPIIAGAIAGAVGGVASNPNEPAKGALIGAIAGAAGGGLSNYATQAVTSATGATGTLASSAGSALTGAGVGAGQAALTGSDPLKGAILGGTTGAVSGALSPATSSVSNYLSSNLGFNSTLADAVARSMTSSGVASTIAAIQGKNPTLAAQMGAMSGAIDSLIHSGVNSTKDALSPGTNTTPTTKEDSTLTAEDLDMLYAIHNDDEATNTLHDNILGSTPVSNTKQGDLGDVITLDHTVAPGVPTTDQIKQDTGTAATIANGNNINTNIGLGNLGANLALGSGGKTSTTPSSPVSGAKLNLTGGIGYIPILGQDQGLNSPEGYNAARIASITSNLAGGK